jgi:hypothetical protein
MRRAVPRLDRRGITVLGLALLIIAVIVGVVVLLRYYPI